MFLAQDLTCGEYFIYRESTYETGTCICVHVFVYVRSSQELRKPRQAKVYVMIQFNIKWPLYCRKFLSENAVTSLCFAYPDSPSEWCSLLPSFLLPSFVSKTSKSLSSIHLTFEFQMLQLIYSLKTFHPNLLF